MDSKQLMDAIKAAKAAVEDCFAALEGVDDYDAEHRACICDDLDEASACLDNALRLARLEAP
jgi:hypothetical protein